MFVESPELEGPGRFPPLTLTIRDGDAGTDDTVDAMRAVAMTAAELPRVREHAARLSSGGARAVYNFLLSRVKFRPDPRGREKIRHPNRMLAEVDATGGTQGDCDDSVTLAVALLLAMGLRPVVVVMAKDPGRFVHTYTGVLEGMRYVPMDPQEGFPFGTESPAHRRKVYAV